MEEGIYNRIQTLIIEGNIADAEHILNGVEEKDAEWHYLSSLIYLDKNWTNEARKQLEIAIELDPENQKYKDELNALKERIAEAQRKYDEGNKKKHMGKEFFKEFATEGCGELCCTAGCECCCYSICEGIGSGC